MDQSVVSSWNEIDAVELVGLALDGQAGAVPTPTVDADWIIPENFLWRVGGESGISAGQFAWSGGMDLYITGFVGGYILE